MAASVGSLEVAGFVKPSMVFWADKAPDELPVRVHGDGTSSIVRLWNAWEGSRGELQSGIGNGGMRVDVVDSRTILRCSDGPGDVDFSSLTVSIVVGGWGA